MLSYECFGTDGSYFAESCADKATGYHTDGGRSVGQWKSGYADEFSLTGSPVTTEQLDWLFNAKHPGTGEQLRPIPAPRTKEKADGSEQQLKPCMVIDLTYSAPKSLSLLLLSPDEGVRTAAQDAHEAAVDAAQKWLIDELIWARPKVGQVVQRRHVGKVLRADFLHFDSRQGDPQIHTHSLVANTVWADGRWRTLDSATLLRSTKAAGAIYQAALWSEATRRLGVAWTPVSANNQADIAGVSSDLMSHFSKRSNQINTAVAELEIESDELGKEGQARLRDAITLGTRQPKGASESLESAVERWTDEAREAGFDLGSTLYQAMAEPEPFVPEVVALAAVDELSRRFPTFRPSRAVEAVVCSMPPAIGTTAEETRDVVLRIAERVLAQPTVFLADRERLVEDAGRLWPGCHFTTSRIIEDEVTILNAVMDGSAQGFAQLDGARVLRSPRQPLGTASRLRSSHGSLPTGVSPRY
ncbi:MobF family relaxase [Candidatus Microthrix parvicella]|uniref:TrwC relaxase domain-containing protein n=1 Tax=Candidatus Neomicrothrix parvicella RN1 TaxID=1229780 RepID=R4Z3I8_9ACTN|nr:MobF family relaxase [Candidatus Microthrix parvicella]CCM65240.1 hypothetical protein BN381_630002 [Candidatus Microthrix parvicella RN1]